MLGVDWAKEFRVFVCRFTHPFSLFSFVPSSVVGLEVIHSFLFGFLVKRVSFKIPHLTQPFLRVGTTSLISRGRSRSPSHIFYPRRGFFSFFLPSFFF